MTDYDLAVRLKEKDQKAFEEAIDRYASLVTGIIRNVSDGCLSEQDIEETAEDVFITLYNNADNIIPGKLKGYICCIAKTRTLNKIKLAKKHILLNIDDYDPEDDFSITADIEKKELISILRSIILEISTPEKEILIRYYYYYQSIPQIAEALQINPGTVKTKLRRTREKIKTKLTERGFSI